MELKWKKVYNNTWKAVDADNTVHVKLHHTVIYKRTMGGLIMLNSGGYRTHTTKKRINTCLEGTPYGVVQNDFAWYLSDRRANTLTPFVDGMTVQG